MTTTSAGAAGVIAPVPQPVLPELFGPRVPRAHKRARSTSREVYRLQRAADVARAKAGRETRTGQALRILAWHWNVTQQSPTALELFDWGVAHGESLFNAASFRPRLTWLLAHGLIEPRARRTCAISGQRAWTWAVREMGSKEPR
jgi:hypothetical protein